MTRLPSLFIPHGGGPWPFVDVGFMQKEEGEQLSRFLKSWPQKLEKKPQALLVISAHWETPQLSLMTSPNPGMYYDYYGFPEESYKITWPVPGAPKLAHQVGQLLEKAGWPISYDESRGYDHGTFVPLKVMFPEADIPTLQLSLKKGLDPEEHYKIGQSLAPLREQGILIIGSGMSFHNLREFGADQAVPKSEAFDEWLKTVATQSDTQKRKEELSHWQKAPFARYVHPREEHLLPLMVVAGAGYDDTATQVFAGCFARMKISAYQFG